MCISRRPRQSDRTHLCRDDWCGCAGRGCPSASFCGCSRDIWTWDPGRTHGACAAVTLPDVGSPYRRPRNSTGTRQSAEALVVADDAVAVAAAAVAADDVAAWLSTWPQGSSSGSGSAPRWSLAKTLEQNKQNFSVSKGSRCWLRDCNCFA